MTADFGRVEAGKILLERGAKIDCIDKVSVCFSWHACNVVHVMCAVHVVHVVCHVCCTLHVIAMSCMLYMLYMSCMSYMLDVVHELFMWCYLVVVIDMIVKGSV